MAVDAINFIDITPLECEIDHSNQNKNEALTEEGFVQKVPNPEWDHSAEDYFVTSPDARTKLRMTKSGYAASPALTFHTMFARTVRLAPTNFALAFKDDKSSPLWAFYNYQQYYNLCSLAAKAFIKLGLQVRHSVAILGFNSARWHIANNAAIFAGGFSCGVYTTNSAEMCAQIGNSSRANIFVVENHEKLQLVLSIRDQLTHLKAIIQYTGRLKVEDDMVYSWDHFLGCGIDVDDEVLVNRLSAQLPNECCSLIHTSGTTGAPKGVMLSHDNITFLATAAWQHWGVDFARDKVISYLPLSHVAAQIIDIYLPIASGNCTYFAQPDALRGSLGDTLKEVRPTVFFGVPRVWEKIMEKTLEVGRSVTGVKRKLADWAKKVALEKNLAQMKGDSSVPWNYKLAKLMILDKIRAALGLDKCRLAVTGAAPMSSECFRFFLSLDIPIYDVFGMSETTGPHIISMPGSSRPGAAGKPIEPHGTACMIKDPDETGNGELCFTGRNIFMGYLNQPDKVTEATTADGWLATGDIAYIDSDGFVFVTGRIKELIITAGGENVAPVPIEDRLKAALPCISNCMLVGDKRKFLSILLTLKTQAATSEDDTPSDDFAASTIRWFQAHGSTATGTTELIRKLDAPENSRVRSAIQTAIDKVNEQSVSRAAKISKWHILPRDFSIAGGELGTTMKLRRSVAAKIYQKEIDELYNV